MPVRNPTNRGGRKRIGWFPSRKMGRMVKWESHVERDYIYYPELDPDVIAYEEQPLKLVFPKGSKFKQYTPDFRLRRRSSAKLIIVEVKTDEDFAESEERERLECARPLLEAQGYEFAVVTSSKIRVEPQLSNLKLLFRFADYPITLQDRLACQSCFADRQVWTLGELASTFATLQYRRELPFALLAEGLLHTDLSKPIDRSAVLVIAVDRDLTDRGSREHE